MGVGVGMGVWMGMGMGGGGGGRAGERGRATEMISYASVVFFSRNFLFQCPKLSPHLMSISVRFLVALVFGKSISFMTQCFSSSMAVLRIQHVSYACTRQVSLTGDPLIYHVLRNANGEEICII